MSEFDPATVAEYELETWSRCADVYLDGFADMTRGALPFLVEAASVGAGDRVLEIGSGPGHVADALRKLGAEVVGVDFSPAMVEVARRSYPEIEFRQADAEDLPYAAASFDKVVSSFAVHHLARPVQVFREVARVLEPGGVFAFTVFGNPEAQSSIGAFFGAVAEHHSVDDLPHGPLFGVTEREVYEPMIREAGLEGLELGLKPFIWSCESADPIVASFRSWGNLSALPEAVQQKIEDATRRNLEEYRIEDGYACPHEALLGRARKPEA